MHLPQALLSFSRWKTIIDGDPLGIYCGTGSFFKACHLNDPTDCVKMNIQDQVLQVDPLGPLSAVLIFSEGNLIYPIPSQQLTAGSIRLTEEMEIKVMLFANPPNALHNIISRLDQPATIEEFKNLMALLSPTECSMLASTITTETYPVEIWNGFRGHRKSRMRLALHYLITPLIGKHFMTSPAILVVIFIILVIEMAVLAWYFSPPRSTPSPLPPADPRRGWVLFMPENHSELGGCVSVPYLGEFPGFDVMYAKLDECLGYDLNISMAGTSTQPCSPECIDGNLQ